MLSDREILDKFKETFDQILPMNATTLKGGRELGFVRNVLTFLMVNLAKPDADRFANDNPPSKRKPRAGPTLEVPGE
jgi:hypothetical protein